MEMAYVRSKLDGKFSMFCTAWLPVAQIHKPKSDSSLSFRSLSLVYKFPGAKDKLRHFQDRCPELRGMGSSH